MLKKIVIAVVVLLVVLGGALGFALYNANSLIAKYKPELEKQASQALGANVSLGNLSASIFPSAGLRIDELKVAGNTPFALKDLVLDLKLLPLLGGRLEIVRLRVDNPSFTYVVQANKSGDKAPRQVEPSASSTSAPKPPSQAAPFSLALNSVEISNGSVTIKDVAKKTEQNFSKLNLLAGLAFGDSKLDVPNFKFSGQALGQIPVEASGTKIVVDLSSRDVTLGEVSLGSSGAALNLSGQIKAGGQSGQIDVSSSGIKLEKLTALYEQIPALKALNLSGTLIPTAKIEFGAAMAGGSGNIRLQDLVLTSGGLKVSDLEADIRFKGNTLQQELSSDNIKLALGGKPLSLSINASQENNAVRIPQLKGELFGGSLDARASLGLKDEKSLAADVKLTNIQVEQALSAFKPATPQVLVGKLNQFTTSVSGSLNAVPQSLNGTSQINLTEGALKGINLASAVTKATNLPFLAGALYAATPPEFKPIMEAQDTKIESLTGTFAINQGAVRTNDLKLVSNIFTLMADGVVGLDMKIDLNATIYFKAEFSKALAQRTKELGALLDKNGQLVIPLTLRGTLPNITVLPNVEKLVQSGAARVIEDKAQKLLGDVLGGKKGQKKGLFGF